MPRSMNLVIPNNAHWRHWCFLKDAHPATGKHTLACQRWEMSWMTFSTKWRTSSSSSLVRRSFLIQHTMQRTPQSCEMYTVTSSNVPDAWNKCRGIKLVVWDDQICFDTLLTSVLQGASDKWRSGWHHQWHMLWWCHHSHTGQSAAESSWDTLCQISYKTVYYWITMNFIMEYVRYKTVLINVNIAVL